MARRTSGLAKEDGARAWMQSVRMAFGDLPQRKFAEIVGVDPSVVSAAEATGPKARSISDEVLQKIRAAAEREGVALPPLPQTAPKAQSTLEEIAMTLARVLDRQSENERIKIERENETLRLRIDEEQRTARMRIQAEQETARQAIKEREAAQENLRYAMERISQSRPSDLHNGQEMPAQGLGVRP